MDGILDFSKPLDVSLLDNVVTALYHGTPAENAEANEVLTRFQDHDDAWSRVDAVLEYSNSEETKFLALRVLENVIKYKWAVLPPDQKEGIRGYVVDVIIGLSGSEESLHTQELYVSKLNLILVQIVKQEWPQNWPSFIPDLVNSSKESESLCENNMAILRLLSEEIFDYSKEEMVSTKVQRLKDSLNDEFGLIYQLCEFILENATTEGLVASTLLTLHRFLNWIPLGFIFETNMIEALLTKFLPVPVSRNLALQCLAEIASLKTGDKFGDQFIQLYGVFMTNLGDVIPVEADFDHTFNTSGEDEQNCLAFVAMFLTNFFKQHLGLLESEPELHGLLHDGHVILARLSAISNENIFKTCLNYWNKLANNLYIEGARSKSNQRPLRLNSNSGARYDLYADVLSNVRDVLIQRMPKPEEVLIVENEYGEIVPVRQKDTTATALYKHMRDTLIFLTHLDYDDTEQLMLRKLNRIVGGSEWSRHNINTLCWAVGSISGAQADQQEKRFLVIVIKALLDLCALKDGKENKAVIASNIMYVVGQYPSFLRAHWRFLRTVVAKLFEFMHEPHPGVKDMAVETFLKISQKCARKFALQQHSETRPYVEEVLENLQETVADLAPTQLQGFYEAVGYMIAAQPDQEMREALIAALFDWPNNTWQQIMGEASKDYTILQQSDVMRTLADILKVFIRGAVSLRHAFVSQIGVIYLDMLNVYKAYSEMINGLVGEYGPRATTRQEVVYMRTVKKDSLKCVETFVERSDDPELVVEKFLPPLMEAVLADYRGNIPGARDAEVLSLMTTIVKRLKNNITSEVPRILDSLFEVTLEMIADDENSFMDIRINFFHLLRAINAHCFQAFLQIPGEVFKYVVEAMMWAAKHLKPEVAEIGLYSLLELLHQAAYSDVAQAFYEAYLLDMIHETFVVLTDSFHKPGFKLQTTLLHTIFHLCESGALEVPIFDTNEYPDIDSNQAFLRQFLASNLAEAFPNLTVNTIEHFVEGMFALHDDLVRFKVHMRDFLISLRTFLDENNDDLFLEEKEEKAAQMKEERLALAQAVPGLLGPYEGGQ